MPALPQPLGPSPCCRAAIGLGRSAWSIHRRLLPRRVRLDLGKLQFALFVTHDHQALKVAEQAFGVKTSIAGPDTIDIPGLITAIEQPAARKPAGMMVVGWDPEAMIPIINQVADQGIPIVCVDADVPKSKRLSFIGTNWYDLGVRQGEAMVKAFDGRKGKVALVGLIEQAIDQQAFDGFRSIAVPAGLDCMEPLQDEGKQSKAYEVAAGLLQANPDLVGMAGFDSESGPGMGQAIKESSRAGKVIATCVEAERQHLELLKAGVLTACIGQKRELFTFIGVQALSMPSSSREIYEGRCSGRRRSDPGQL